ncbi:glycosyltransferase family 9 protein [Pseudothioglobus sp. nBUS_23]|uniref:glycosyltransferase family 9 protein n=1 Tax=Pseudothioglobus sp. nBUS_23 TaxID=3395318 RepID=UPI003EBA2247
MEFERTYTLPFINSIANLKDEHFRNKNIFKRYIKFLKRLIYISVKHQKTKEIFEILPIHQNILWINLSAPSLGDSLMDLSSRILLKGRKIDLFTDKKNYHLYLDDEVFSGIFTNTKELEKEKYDLVILDSYSSRTIKAKSNLAKKTPYVSMYGYFNGPEVNRILFSFYQMNHLLGYVKSEGEIHEIAKNLISISDLDKIIVQDLVPSDYVAIVLGGEWKYKTYSRWNDLILNIKDYNKTNFIFIGSKNATDDARQITKRLSNEKFLDLTGRLTFNQSVEVINKSRLTLCCDGGLFHGATAIQANIIVLLARLAPEMLTTKRTKISYLYDESNVNNISIDSILEKYYEKVNLFDNHPQSE